jgi:hypothetical protein
MMGQPVFEQEEHMTEVMKPAYPAAGMAAQDRQRKPAIHESQDRMEAEIDDLAGALERFSVRLDPVLTPDAGEESSLDSSPSPPQSEVTRRAQYQADRIAGLRMRVNHLAERLEV